MSAPRPTSAPRPPGAYATGLASIYATLLAESEIAMNRGPEPLGEILSRLFTARGWGRRSERVRLEEAWASVVGKEKVGSTKLGTLRRGVLEVIVGNAVLMQELVQFQKKRLIEGLRKELPSAAIADIRFRAGTVGK